MDREQAKELLPIIQAFAEGKIIQSIRINGRWIDLDINTPLSNTTLIEEPQRYRIKPEPKYRPFKDAEECCQEMQKHQPFGWVIRNNVRKVIVAEVLSDGVVLHNQSGSYYNFEEANRILTFVDGTVFGIKEE